MFEYYSNNYISTSSYGKDWELNIKPSTRKHLSFKEESILAAQRIYETNNDPICVLLSGGRDSLWTARSFYEAKVPFTASIMSWGDLNSHDTNNAVNFCEQFGILYNLLYLDIIDFISSGRHCNLSFEVGSWTHQIAPIIEILKNVEGIPVLGNGDPMFITSKPFKRWDWFYYDMELLNLFGRYFIKNNIKGIPEFFRYTPELFLSYINDPIFLDMIKNQEVSENLHWRSQKYKMYESYYSSNYTFPKYDGWEILADPSSEYYQLYLQATNDISSLKKITCGEFIISHSLLQKKLNYES
jgi:hypothetical protein